MKNAFIFAIILFLIGGAFFCGALIANGGFHFNKELTTKTVTVDKEFSKYMKENKTARIATICGLFVGAFFGVLAFYNGWLG